MAVYTEVSIQEASTLLHQLKLGKLVAMQACSGGIENTNYFVSTERGDPSHPSTHHYVLTLFERLSFEQLPFYLRLMKHLAQHGIAVPDPAANADGDLVFTVKGKPAAVVDRLRGKSALQPTPAHCACVGRALAHMHKAVADFKLHQPNLRGLSWWNETVPVVLPHLTPAQAALLQSELCYQNHISASSAYKALPCGTIHADLFRDNVMFEDHDGAPELTGFFDFYFAGYDSFAFDIAVTLNDWCVDLATGAHHAERADALLSAYTQERALSAAERELLPALLRAGALRFWISRLWDWHLPREASLLKPHDPTHFERILRQRAFHPDHLLHTLGQPCI